MWLLNKNSIFAHTYGLKGEKKPIIVSIKLYHPGEQETRLQGVILIYRCLNFH